MTDLATAVTDPDAWRHLPLPVRRRLRWRLLTDMHPEPALRRPEQLTPSVHALCPRGEACDLHDEDHVNWDVWFLKGGRGAGKGRAGAEDVANYAIERPKVRIALVGATSADVRDTMVEGESGLLSIIPEELLRGENRSDAWNRSLLELHLKNGSRFDGYSSEVPSRLRGPQFHRGWADELAAWADAHLGEVEDTTWSNLMLGMRLGDDPKTIVTTTPRNVKLVKELLFDNPDARPAERRPNRNTVTVTMSTYNNVHNLAPAFKARILRKYEGTRAGRQEIHAEVVEDAEGALWERETIERARVPRDTVVEFSKVTVSGDPAVTSNQDSDDTGIVVVGLSRGPCPICVRVLLPGDTALRPHAFVLADRTCHLPPRGWAGKIVDAFVEFKADDVVGEVNNGGDLVAANVQAVAPNIPFKPVRASRGKKVRAEPVASLFGGPEVNAETGEPTGVWLPTRVHVVGSLPYLEDQMCLWDPDKDADSPDRVDAMCWGIWHLMLGDLMPHGEGKIVSRERSRHDVPTGVRSGMKRVRHLNHRR